MLQSLNPDIISLNETHLVAEDVVELSGYSWFGNNRKRHIKAPKGSGGVGFLVRSELFEHFKIKVMDKFVDDIIGVHFEHRNTSYNFVVITSLAICPRRDLLEGETVKCSLPIY